MCDVMTTAGALGLAGQGLSGLARLSDARKAEKRARRAAAGEEAAARDRADDARRRAKAERGSRRARFAKAGVKPGGTPTAVLKAIETDGEAEARDLIGRGQSRADAIRDRARAERRRAHHAAGRRAGAPAGRVPGDRHLAGRGARPMTVASATNRARYDGDGASTVFAVPFYFLEPGDLKLVRTEADGSETVLVPGVDYDVTGAGDPAGGSVTLATAPVASQQIVILRDIAPTQETDFEENADLPAETLERGFDRLTMLIQQIVEQVARSMLLPTASALTDVAFPAPENDKAIVGNSTNDGFVSKDLTGLGAVIVPVSAANGGTGLAASLAAADFGKGLQMNAAGTAFETVASEIGFRNRIINGGFDIWQRGTSFTAANLFAPDRWRVGTSNAPTSITISRQSFAPGQTDVPGEPTYFARIDKADNSAFFTQNVEDVRTLAGKPIVVSFYAKAGAAATQSMTINQNFGAGGSSQVAVGVTLSSTAVGTGWARYTATATLPSIAGKTIGAGSYVQVNIAPANGAVIYDLADVQLEAGGVATPFERRPFGVEFAMCRWFFRKSYNADAPPGAVTDVGSRSFFFLHEDGGNLDYGGSQESWEEMRKTPDLTLYNPANGTSGTGRASGGGDIAVKTRGLGANGVSFYQDVNVAAVGQWVKFHYTLDAEL